MEIDEKAIEAAAKACHDKNRKLRQIEQMPWEQLLPIAKEAAMDDAQLMIEAYEAAKASRDKLSRDEVDAKPTTQQPGELPGLERCPFCDGRAALRSRHGGRPRKAHCDNKSCEAYHCDIPLSAWNRRPPERESVYRKALEEITSAAESAYGTPTDATQKCGRIAREALEGVQAEREAGELSTEDKELLVCDMANAIEQHRIESGSKNYHLAEASLNALLKRFELRRKP